MIAAALLAMAVSALTCAVLVRHSDKLGLIDVPNERSLHQKPVPRSGGIGLLAGICAGSAWLLSRDSSAPAWLWIAGIAAVAVAVVSLFDDYEDVPSWLRFGVHLAASATPFLAGVEFQVINFPGHAVHLPLLGSIAFTVAFVVWYINFYNFMDGMDGFAGSMALIGFTTMSILALRGDHLLFAGLTAAIAAAAAGFLLFNAPPAKIFMGDVGSATLGFLAAFFTIWADHAGIFPVWIGVLAFSAFAIDATVTLFRRLARREKIWEAHRTHFYQRLVRSGWSHRKTTGWAVVLMLATSASALLLQDAPAVAGALALVAWVAVYAAIAWFVNRREHAAGV